MAPKKPRYLIKRELERASNNLDMCMNHLITIRTQCKEGKRPDLMSYIDKIGEGCLYVQQSIEVFKAVVDGKLPTAEPKAPDYSPRQD